MHTRATITKPQTLKQAKAEYKKYGPRISSQEQRQLDRSIELLRRADAIKDAERRRKKNAEKKRMREERVREERRRLNIASPEPYVSPRQTRMGTFFNCTKLGVAKAQQEDKPTTKGDVDGVEVEQSEVETEPSTDVEDEPQQARESMPKDEANASNAQNFDSFSSFNEDLVAALDKQVANSRVCGTEGNTEDKPRSASSEIANTESADRDHDSPGFRDQALILFVSTQDILLDSDDLLEIDGNRTSIDAAPEVKGKSSHPSESTPAMSIIYPKIEPRAASNTDIHLQDGLMLPPQLPNADSKRVPCLVDAEPWDFELSTQDFQGTP